MVVTFDLRRAGRPNTDVELGDGTVSPLIEELRIASLLLAAKIEDAALSSYPKVNLDPDETQQLAAAADLLIEGRHGDDPGLLTLSHLGRR
jgi:hypothetical protein